MGNKYDGFSKKVKDPLKEAMEREQNKVLSIKNAYRGTTVQITPHSSSTMKTNSTRQFGDIQSIVPSDPFTFGYIQIGRISGLHGVKGELKLNVESDFTEYYLRPGATVYIRRPNRLTPRPTTVVQCRKQVENVYLLALQNIEDRERAARFRDYVIYIRKEDRPSLNLDEYLVRDLVGLNCTVKGRVIGSVIGVVLPSDLCDSVSIAAKMHALLEVKLLSSGQLCLLPFVPAIVTHVDADAKLITVVPPEGLLDLTYEEKVKVVIRGFLPEVATITPAMRKWLETLYTPVVVSTRSAGPIDRNRSVKRKETPRKRERLLSRGATRV